MLYEIARPVLFSLDPETAHETTLTGLHLAGRLLPAAKPIAATPVEVMGLQFPNRIGLAAGPFRFGAFVLVATGYPSPVLVLPTVSAQLGRVGANLIAVPNLPGYSGYLGLQLRFALD